MVGMGATSPRPMCRLCLQAADRMTHEDVIPEWLRSHQIAGMDDPTEWSQLIRRVRTRVCGRCNDRMNVAFEQPARPLVIGMLDHDRLRMSGPEQRAVAHWMMKVTLLYGLMRHWRDDVEPAVHPDGSDGWNHAISQEEKRADLHRLMEAGEMPPETTIAVIAASPESSGKQLLPRTDALHGGYSTTNLFTMLFEVVTRDHMASRHRTARRADPRWVMIWPPIAGDNASWPPKRLTSVVEIIKFQEVVSRTAHFMTMGPQREDNTPAALRRHLEDQGM